MVVNVEQIQMGITRFVELEIANKATGFNKFAVYFILPKISTKVTDLINNYKENIMFKDLFDDNGNVNISEIYNMAKSAISKSGQFTFYNIIFNESDIDKLYKYIIDTTV